METKAQYTPGPWVSGISGGRQVLYVASETAWICGELRNQSDMPADEAEANARLIAAAPDLLKALEALATLAVKGHSILARLQFSAEGRELSQKVSSAIAKARGQ